MRLAALVLLGTMTSSAGAGEALRYEWQVSGLARLILPSAGGGTLTTRTEGDEVHTELLITATSTADFFRYGSRLDRENRTLRSVWSSYRFGKREKSRDEDVTNANVVDVASGILQLRRDPPRSPRNLTIWSDGRLYPVVVRHVGLEDVELASGERPANHYTIRGRKVVGEREWKGSLDLWLGLDEAATPLKIEVARSFSRVELRLLDAG